MASLGNIENEEKPSSDSSPVTTSVDFPKAVTATITTIDPEQLTSRNDLASQSSNQVKILAPAMTRDMTLPSSGKKVPMIMVPVPDTGHLLAIPLSAINQFKESNQMVDCAAKDEQQARDLLNWNDGIGTLDGCDLRFKINELGILELIDSDDDFENHRRQTKTAPPIRQISPGSSLLRDGPDHRRHSQRSVKSNSNHQSHQNNHHNILLSEKILPKQLLRANIDLWTVEDVKKFVDSIPGCEGYGVLFESHKICGKSLMYLDQRDLLDIINVKLGPAVKIFHAITLLKSRSRSQ